MRISLGLFLFFSSLQGFADTMDHYMNISSQIPQMEMKADSKSQAWARSARTILLITNESIAETLLHANDIAQRQGHPLFCLPPSVSLSASNLNDIIIKTYRENSSQQNDKDRMTVSQMAWLGVSKTYPCQGNGKPAANSQNPAIPLMQHMGNMVR